MEKHGDEGGKDGIPIDIPIFFEYAGFVHNKNL